MTDSVKTIIKGLRTCCNKIEFKEVPLLLTEVQKDKIRIKNPCPFCGATLTFKPESFFISDEEVKTIVIEKENELKNKLEEIKSKDSSKLDEGDLLKQIKQLNEKISKTVKKEDFENVIRDYHVKYIKELISKVEGLEHIVNDKLNQQNIQPIANIIELKSKQEPKQEIPLEISSIKKEVVKEIEASNEEIEEPEETHDFGEVLNIADVIQNLKIKDISKLSEGDPLLSESYLDDKDTIVEVSEGFEAMSSEDALNIILKDTTTNFLITGPAGTGKSTLLRELKEKREEGEVIFLCPTGIAALNIDGKTIHSFLQDIKSAKANFLDGVKTIVIDEISMCRSDLLGNLNKRISDKLKTDGKFMGGKQMIFLGDLYQLPPVVGKDDKHIKGKEYFFYSDVYKKGKFRKIELNKIYRQKNKAFSRLLSRIRTDSYLENDLKVLNSRVVPSKVFETLDCIQIVSTNAEANEINNRKLEELESDIFTSKAINTDKLSDDYFGLMEQELKVKEGAKVLFIKNDTKTNKWVNGTFGKIIEIETKKGESAGIKVEIEGSKEIVIVKKQANEIYKEVFSEGRLKRVKLGEIVQYPIKLGWAITIHKSQGQTYEEGIVNLGHKELFSTGMGYVALSRFQTLEKLYLTRPIKEGDIRVDPRIKDFFKNKIDGKETKKKLK